MATTSSNAPTSLTAYYGGLALNANGTLSYTLSDGLGSVSESVNTSGSVTASQLYGPYGAVRYQSASLPTSYGYTGQRADAATGLDYYNARYYDPIAGQFTSADISLAGGLNRYAYVLDDPSTLTDPNGRAPERGGPLGGWRKIVAEGAIAVAAWIGGLFQIWIPQPPAARITSNPSAPPPVTTTVPGASLTPAGPQLPTDGSILEPWTIAYPGSNPDGTEGKQANSDGYDPADPPQDEGQSISQKPDPRGWRPKKDPVDSRDRPGRLGERGNRSVVTDGDWGVVFSQHINVVTERLAELYATYNGISSIPTPKVTPTTQLAPWVHTGPHGFAQYGIPWYVLATLTIAATIVLAQGIEGNGSKPTGVGLG